MHPCLLTLAFPDCFPCSMPEGPFKCKPHLKCKPNLSFQPPGGKKKGRNSVKSQNVLRFPLICRPTESTYCVPSAVPGWLGALPLPLPLGSIWLTLVPGLTFLISSNSEPCLLLAVCASHVLLPCLSLPQYLRQPHC